MSLHISKLAVDIIAEDQIILPAFKGSTFRGAIGNSLKNMVCIRRDRDCGRALSNINALTPFYLRPQCLWIKSLACRSAPAICVRTAS